jgi:hypothetical protein
MSRFSARLTIAYLSVLGFLATCVQALSPLTSRMRAPRSQRAATFIEYAILAAIAVIIGIAINAFLAGSSGWIARMLNTLNNSPVSTSS